MQKIAILLRKTSAINRFREIILASFKSDDFDKLLICSGFFQGRKNYDASTCFNSNQPRFPCIKSVVTVGLYNNMWKPDYLTFINGLQKITCPCGRALQVEKRKISKGQWHAKIFIAFEENIPQLGIIGSSNMTSRAFGINRHWNYESDVVMWDDENKSASSIMTTILNTSLEENNPNSILVADYNPEDRLNRGLPISKRLKDLYDEIIELSVDLT
jgi:hypothetical protein